MGYRKDIPRLLAISNLEISCSSREGLPVNVIEAGIMGLPCIVTDCRGNRDLIKDGVNGYVIKINDIDSLVSKIKELILNQDILNKFGRENRIMMKEYGLDRVMPKMESLYKKYGVS